MSLHDAITALQAGRMIILTDDESRENEGDLILPAQFATPEGVNFMAMHGRGLICLALTGAQVDRLGLPPMVGVNRANRSTAFTVSVEARVGITTGISAADRATTMRLAAAPDVRAGDIVSPGHVFPLRAAAGGVLARDGHTEGGTDLMRLAGLHDGAVICEIMRDDGQMARADDLQAFAARHDLPIISIHDIAEYRLRHENLLDQVAQTVLPTVHGRFQTHGFRSQLDGQEHLALVNGGDDIPLVRLHSECLTGDVLGSLRCDCGPQLQTALQLIGDQGGLVLYLRGHEGRGIGLAEKMRAYALQDAGLDTIAANEALGHPAEARAYWPAAHMLRALGRSRIRLLTNNPEKAAALVRYGIDVVEVVPLRIAPNPFNQTYLDTKRTRLGHTL